MSCAIFTENGSLISRVELTLFGSVRFSSAMSTFVRTKIVLLPFGSHCATRSVTLLLSASTEPSCKICIRLSCLDEDSDMEYLPGCTG